MKTHRKRPKRILVWKPSKFWRQNANWTTEKFLKELLNNQERKHRKTWSKKCRDGYNTAYTKKATSWTISERNSPNKASTKAKFLKNCWWKNTKKIPSQFRRQNAKQTARSHPYTSLEGMANCEKLGFLYTRIGSKVRVSHCDRSAIFFFTVVFLF